MRLYEQVKIFMGGDVEELESKFNTWIKEQMDDRAKVPILSNKPFTILDRNLVIKNYDGDETYAMSIHYEYADLDPNEMGPDRGDPNFAGASMIASQDRSRRRR